jgi:protease I
MARVAILLDAGFEDSELRVPHDRLREAGHQVTIVGRKAGAVVIGKREVERVTIEASIGDVDPYAFDALVIPGGRSPERLMRDARVVDFTRSFSRTGRPVAAVCHGPLLLAAAGVVRGRALTSYPGIREDLEESGAAWLDREVVEDGALITSRRPADLEPFSRALLRRLGPQAAVSPAAHA